MAKLEAAELQFTRWGATMGFLKEPFDHDALFKASLWSEEDIKKAKKWMGHIQDAFDDAEKISDRYKLSLEGDEDESEILEVLDRDAELEKTEPKVKRLVYSMRKITRRRQKEMGLGKKMKWAIYRKTDFESLVEVISRLVDNLVKLFPALHPQQKELCQEEMKSIEKESIPALVEVLGKNDKFLNLAIAEEIKTHGNVFQDVVVDGTGFTRLGDTYENAPHVKPKGMKFTGLHIGGSGTTHAGHRVTASHLAGEEGANKSLVVEEGTNS